MIIRFVGHEGVKEKHGLRRLLQACIDYLQHEPKEVWQSALITIYDEDDNVYKIASGARKYGFICRLKDGDPFIKNKSGLEDKMHQSSCRAIDYRSQSHLSRTEVAKYLKKGFTKICQKVSDNIPG